MTPEELEALAVTHPMRRMITRQCQSCKHEWLQPSLTGACPMCHETDVVTIRERVSELDRT